MNFEGIARPYTKAVFDIAKENGEVSAWLECVETVVCLVENKEFQSLVHSPSTHRSDVVKIILSALKGKEPKSFESFIELLIENNRLPALPALQEQLVKAISLDSKVRQAEIRVAKDLDKAKLDLITKALEKRFDCKVEVQVKVDVSVLGGAIIRMDDDTVFDGSLAARLDKLEYLLAS
jgi:F-type H+-transporting ATPase subunit delta